MRLRNLLIFTLLIGGFSISSQVKPGEWKDHLSYNTCNTVAKVGNIVYASNGTGIVKYNPDDGSVERLNKINGLSDIGIRLLRFNPYNNTLLIIYENANIDVIKNNSITNVSDINRKTITAKKTINEVVFKNNLAYLACGFGIVVFDTDKLEIKDTYYIGPGGTYTNVYQVAFTDSTFFAATPNGLLKANYLNSLLNNFQSWKTVPSLPLSAYNGVVRYNNKIIANYSPSSIISTTAGDTLYEYNGISWAKSSVKTFPYFNRKIYAPENTNFLCLQDNFGYEIYNSAGTRLSYITGYSYGVANIRDVYTDFSDLQNISYWIADFLYGLIDSKGGYPFFPNTKISINGTHSNYASSVFVSKGNVVSAPVVVDETGSLKFSREGLNYYDGSNWSYVKDAVNDTIYDMNYALIDKKDPTHLWASSWKNGLIEYKDGKMTNVYNSFNSAIPYFSVFHDWHRVAGLCQDIHNNLWIGNSDVTNFLSVRKTNGTFQTFEFATGTPMVGRVMADKNDQIWVCFPRGSGLAVFKNNNFANPNSSNFKMLTTDSLKGHLPSLYVNSIVEDLDGHIWIGTTAGVAVFYSPANVTGSGNFDCQQIKITQDGHVQILLETEKVTALAVDGANRKWVGTESSGIFCFSPDGQTQVFHFTADNSPLFSNTVIDLSYDDVTGDVFTATDQGLQSYRTSVVKGDSVFTNVHAYPNPVRPGYTGTVFIRGLMDQSVVKITDAAGNLVWEAKSQGGQIEWNLKTLAGQRVVSGVYLAYCATTDGTQKAVAKLMVLD